MVGVDGARILALPLGMSTSPLQDVRRVFPQVFLFVLDILCVLMDIGALVGVPRKEKSYGISPNGMHEHVVMYG